MQSDCIWCSTARCSESGQAGRGAGGLQGRVTWAGGRARARPLGSEGAPVPAPPLTALFGPLGGHVEQPAGQPATQGAEQTPMASGSSGRPAGQLVTPSRRLCVLAMLQTGPCTSTQSSLPTVRGTATESWCPRPSGIRKPCMRGKVSGPAGVRARGAVASARLAVGA